MPMRALKCAFKRAPWNAGAESATGAAGAALLFAILFLVKGSLAVRAANAQSAVTPFVLRTETYSFAKTPTGD